MSRSNDMMCCGTLEFQGLNEGYGPENLVAEILCAAYSKYYDTKERPCAHIIMTDVVAGNDDDNWGPEMDPPDGEAFASLVEKEKLGVIVSARRTKNPNSGNMVKAYIFTPNWTRMKSFANRHGRRWAEFVERKRLSRRDWRF